MARQSSIIKIQGTIQDLTFYKSGDGHMVKAKSSIAASKIKNDPKFARTRENMAEFGHAGITNKILRTAIRSLVERAKDRYSYSRLSSKLMEIIKTDMVSDRGSRKVFLGDLNLLAGFEFNALGKLSGTLFGNILHQIDAANQKAIQTGAIIPAEDLKSPAGSTHFKITNALLFIDFNDPVQQELAISATPISEITMDPFQINSEAEVAIDPVNKAGFQFVLIEFFQEVNGKFYILKNGTHNCLQLVNVMQ